MELNPFFSFPVVVRRLLTDTFLTTSWQDNKHWEILVSCSDKERNCIQAHETAFKLMDLHAFCTHFWTFWWILVKMSWLINHNWTVGLKPGQGLLAARLLWEWMSESYNFHIHQKSCSLVNVVDTFAVAKRLLFMVTISSIKPLSYSPI